MDEPIYTLSEVADAAGVQVTTLRSWLQRGHLRLDMAIGDSPSEIAGKAHLVTLRRALHIGAAVELIRNDVEPSRAFKAARAFVDHSDPLESDGHMRDPGELFETGYTVLVASPDREVGDVIRIDRNTNPLAILFPSIGPGQRRSGTFVWLNKVVEQIRTALVEKR